MSAPDSTPEEEEELSPLSPPSTNEPIPSLVIPEVESSPESPISPSVEQPATLRSWLPFAVTAGVILALTNGTRQSLGLFIGPITKEDGLDVATVSFALAVGQFVFGFVQPFSGAAADRFGSTVVLCAGILICAIGAWVTVPAVHSDVGIVFTLGILLNAGVGCCSFAVLIGSVSNQLPVSKRGVASGVANAGSSLGQFVLPPIIQSLIANVDYKNAFYATGAFVLIALPAIFFLRFLAKQSWMVNASSAPPKTTTLKEALKLAFGDKSYALVHLSFFTCGFFVSFIGTHLPGEIALHGLSSEVAGWCLAIIGVGNVLGSLLIGQLVGRYRAKWLLFCVYLGRAILCGVYVALPKTALTLYLVSAVIGLLWLSTVPPTATIVGRLYGTQFLGSLFGLTLVSHQIGGFLGAYLGGLNVAAHGNFTSLWWAAAGLSAFAAACNLPIPEPYIQLKQG